MISLLIKGIFFVITKLFDIIMTPFVAGITALFPDVGVAFSYLTAFVSMCTEYMVTICKLLLVPQGALIMLFDFFFILSAIFVIKQSISLVTTIYNKFKP